MIKIVFFARQGVFLENYVGRLWKAIFLSIKTVFLAWKRVFLEKYVGRLWKASVFVDKNSLFRSAARISREWRGTPMEFAYFSRMAWVAYGIYVFLEDAYGIRTLG